MAPRAKKNPSTLEHGDLFVGELAPFEIARSGQTGLSIDGHSFVAWMPPQKSLRAPGVTKVWDLPGRLVVFEYFGPDSRYSVPAIELRAIVGPAEAKGYARWGDLQDEQFDLARTQRERNPALPPFDPAEVEDVRTEIQRAVGAVAERRGLKLQYDEVAPTEKAIPIRFKLTRRAPEQKDLFGNPQTNPDPSPSKQKRKIWVVTGADGHATYDDPRLSWKRAVTEANRRADETDQSAQIWEDALDREKAYFWWATFSPLRAREHRNKNPREARLGGRICRGGC